MKNYINFIFMVFLVLIISWSCASESPEIEKVVKMKFYNCSSDTITKIKVNFVRNGQRKFESVPISKLLIPKDSIYFEYNATNDINDNEMQLIIDFKKLQSINSLFLNKNGTYTYNGSVSTNGIYFNNFFIENNAISYCRQTLNNLGEVISDSSNCKSKLINQ